MDTFSAIVTKIIESQESIIGPVAVEQANKISGLTIDWSDGKHSVVLNGNKASIVDKLVNQYKVLFGQTSVEVCREAASELLPKLKKNEVPAILK